MGPTLKHSLKNKIITFGLIGAGFSFIYSDALAQNARIGMVFTSSAKECAMACTADMTCAAWVYAPVKIGTTGAVSYTHLDVYKRQKFRCNTGRINRF